MLSLKEKILLLLYLTLEEWDSGLEVLYHPRQFFYSSFSRRYKGQSIRQRIWEMENVGDVKRMKKGGRDVFQITSQGRKAVSIKVPLLRFRREWDGLWRLVIFDIEERSHVLRDAIRKKLRSLGFGQWQRSIWITPFDVAKEIDEYLENLSLKGPVEALEARRLFVSDEKELARRIWRLDRLNKKYLALAKEWEEGRKRCQQDLETLKKLAASLQGKYLKIFYSDPGLPFALLPDDWAGEKVKGLFKEWASLQG